MEAQKRKTQWKKYLKIAEKALALIPEHDLTFDVEWLKDAVKWIEKNEFVTDNQRKAIWNVFVTLKKMVHWKKEKERRKRGN